jgi:hypothetical protein
MRDSFLDDPNFFRNTSIFLLAMPVLGILFAACSQPSTPEEKVAAQEQTVKWLKDDLVVLVPRPGVECYVLRSHRADVGPTMSCIGNVPVTIGQ